ncbi:drug-responsive transcription factor pdr3 [Sarracenia purpurea var. burkii]
MAQLVGNEEIESLKIELAEIGKSLRPSFRRHPSSFRSITSGLGSSIKDHDDPDEDYEEFALQWAAIERLPTFERLRSSLFHENNGNPSRSVDDNVKEKVRRVTDVTKIGALERHMFIDKLIKHIEDDNLRLLQKLRKRIDK